MTRPENKIL